MSVLTVDGTLQPKGFEQVTTLSSAKGLTVPTGARLARLQATDQVVRWRDDGVDPTSTTGMLLAVGESIWYAGDLSAVKFIEATASAKLNVSYYSG